MLENSDLDFEVVEVVFKLDPTSFKWGVPFFSENREAAAMINTEMAFRTDGSKERYDSELERIAIGRGWKSEPKYFGGSVFFMLLLPHEICNAAIRASRGDAVEAKVLNTYKCQM